MKLTDRLLKIASLVDNGKRIADIGTDHGYIPVYLLNQNKIQYAILGDVNKGPLENARKEVTRNKLQDKVDLRLGSGIEVLKENEVDEIIIAGMGGMLINSLLKANEKVAHTTEKLILQPMQAPEELRMFLYQNGYTKPVTDQLDAMGIQHSTFYEVEPDPTLACAKKGAEQMRLFNPDVVIAVGGGSAMDAAKIMWVMYEHPECNFLDLAMRFMDIRKRVYQFPQMGKKAKFVAIPTSSGTGSEVTPFAVITDEETGQKYPLADYELMPTIAIVDADMMMHQPKGLTSASGIDALTHALEAYAAMLQTEFTDGLALQATKSIFEYLPRAYENGAKDPIAREKMAHASTMAGMAFANAFLGVCHSLAHKLGAYHHIPHGVANALLINKVLEFNVNSAPRKMGTFPQYAYPNMLARYAEVATFVGCTGTDEEKFEQLQQKINELKAAVGIPNTIKEFGIDEKAFLDTLDEMVEQAFDDQCTGANPRYPLMKELKEMYITSYYGENAKNEAKAEAATTKKEKKTK